MLTLSIYVTYLTLCCFKRVCFIVPTQGVQYYVSLNQIHCKTSGLTDYWPARVWTIPSERKMMYNTSTAHYRIRNIPRKVFREKCFCDKDGCKNRIERLWIWLHEPYFWNKSSEKRVVDRQFTRLVIQSWIYKHKTVNVIYLLIPYLPYTHCRL